MAAIIKSTQHEVIRSAGSWTNHRLSNTVELIKKRGPSSVKDFLAAADIAIENIELSLTLASCRDFKLTLLQVN
jgi:hypothetical protein